MKRVCYTELDYDELESIIAKFYNIKDVSVVSMEEWSNDEDHVCNVEKEEISKYDLRLLEELKQGKNPTYCLGAVLADLANNNILEEGKYLIRVSW